ncbi:ABC transporter related [Leptolyngbya sp. NIES-3755]|nr:ABC transporter related [Leptolyngbya sp. NIES-3755]
MKTFQAIRGLLPLVKFYPWAMSAIVVLGVLSSLSEGFGLSLFIPLLQSVQQTDASSGNFFLSSINQIFSEIPNESRFVFIAAFIFVCILLKSILTYANTVLFAWLNSRISHQLRSNIFNQLLSVSGSYLERNDTGKFINTLATETWQTSRALSIFVNLIIDSCTVLVFAVFLLLISWQLTIWVCVAIVLISVAIQSVTRQVKSIGQTAVQANQSLADRIWEGLGGMRVIRAFGRERYEQKRFDRASEQVRRSFFKLEMLSGVVSPLSEILSAALLLLILVVALRANQTALPTLLTFVFILYRLQPKVKQVDGARVALASLISSVAEVMALLDRSDKPYLISGHIPFQGLKREIQFEQVTFHYNPDESPAVQNISLSIPQGKTTAFVGPSGAGKSTLINLLCRFSDPTIGEIYIDGCLLRQLQLETWRDRLAIVSQDIYMFSTTVRENIAYGQLDATDDEIIKAAQLANADEFIRQLPAGYDTHIGDRGVRLSGGQRQRITLARAIIRDPEILILDEATNALDSIAEDLIQEALKTLSRNRTVIVIAHRLSTIEQADQIIVLNQGQVVEQGNLNQLLANRGLFTQLYQLQNRKH